MHQSAIVLRPTPGWAQTVLKEVAPGAHVAVLAADDLSALEGRRAGFYMRDCLSVLSLNGYRGLYLFRSPLSASTVAANVLEHGVGGIHIAACHVGDDVRVNQPCGSPDNAYSGGWNTNPQATLATGRWPTNLLCVHPSGCKIVGRMRVKSGAPPPAGVDVKGKYKQTYELGWSVRSTVHHGENGWEEIDQWDCLPGCVLPAINDDAELEAGRFYPQLLGETGLLDWITALIAPPDTQPFLVL